MGSMDDGVAVLLSSFNGARFVVEQLASIRTQTHRNIQIFWRDDASTDGTLDIVARCFGMVPLETGPRGVIASYRWLLQAAYDMHYRMFAFADQDDVWAPDKVERAVTALRGVRGPALYCARQVLVDTELRRIGVSPPFHGPIGFPAALTQNIATGCTILLNRPAVDLILKTLRGQQFHDWWSYLMIAAAGGQVITDEAEVVQYRQHAGNAIGAPATVLNRAKAAIRRGPRAFMNILRDHVAMLQRHIELLSPHARQDLAVIAAALAGGPFARRQALSLSGFRRQTLSEDLLFRLWFVIG